MKNLHTLFACSFYLLFLFTTNLLAQENEPAYPELAEEIVEMRDTDQKLRHKWMKMIKKGKRGTKKYKEFTKGLLNTDRNNTARMQEIIALYGWPTYDKVGKKASSNAWLIVQHADRNPLFQKQCLPLLKEAMENEQASPTNYAYLYDRVQVAFGEKQLYATQSTSNNGLWEGHFQPIEDESNVQNRREEMGISESIEDYAESMGFNYSIPSIEEAIDRAHNFQREYEENIQKARKAMEAKDYLVAAQSYLKATESNGSIKTEDFVEQARAISLSKHDKSSSAAFYLIKAAVRGYSNIDDFNTNSDFQNIKEASEENWNDLMNVIKSIKEAKKV